MLATETIKIQLIHEITTISDDNLLKALDLLIQKWKLEEDALMRLVKPRKKTLDIEQLKKEQNFTHFDKITFKELIKELNIQEPIEDLLKMV
jgi:hypothetical protein